MHIGDHRENVLANVELVHAMNEMALRARAITSDMPSIHVSRDCS